MKTSTKKSWPIVALLSATVSGLLLLSPAAHANVGVSCSTSNCVAPITGGLWNENGLGQCLFVLPTPVNRQVEELVGPSVPNGPACVGGLAPTNLVSNNDVAVSISSGSPDQSAYSWSYTPQAVYDAAADKTGLFPASLASAQFMPDSCGVTDFDPPSLNRRNGTFDNGDTGPQGERPVIEPMSATLTLDADVTGDAKLSYYFMEGSLECRALDWTLTVDGVVFKTGQIANFKDGKYLQFNLTGLMGGEVIRLDVINTQPVGSTPAGCPVNLTPGVNSVISGVFVEGTSICEPPVEPASLGDRVWIDADGDGQQDCSDDPALGGNGNGILGDSGDAGTECGNGVSGVKVNLWEGIVSASGNCQYRTWLEGDTTDASGFYGFNGLDAGDYCVSWVNPDPDRFACTIGNVGDDASDSDGGFVFESNCFLSTPVTLAPGETNLTVDLGLIEKPQQPLASLGDRVWEDVDADGVQDCVDGGANDPDNPADGIVGNDGDSGPECDKGLDNVSVELYDATDGVCSDTPAGPTTTTDSNGFYLFTNLLPGEYCVKFGDVAEDFCTVDGFDLGDAALSKQGATADDELDSDADVTTRLSDAVTLLAGDNDLSVDAGIYCPAKIGDRVWLDDGNGLQDNGETEVSGITVELYECTDGQAIVADDKFVDFRVTDADLDNDDMNYMFGAEENFDLEPGTYFVRFLKDGYEFTVPNAGDDDTIDSDCAGGITSCTTVGSRGIDLTQDCGLVVPPPDCNLLLDKECRVETPPPPTFDKCDGKLQQFTLTATTALTGIALGDPANGTGVSATSVAAGGELTVFGPFSNNDVEITFNGGQFGQSVFHTSCSDSEFNSPDDCGKPAGDGKDSNAGFDNIWTLAGFIDNSGRVLDCDGGADGEFAQECSFEKSPLPTCENGEKPETLTWRYDGGAGNGTCAGSTFDPTSPNAIVNEDGKLHEDFECSGSVNPTQSITVLDDGGMSYSVAPGGTFTTPRSDIDAITLTDASGSVQSLVFHSSCSQPLEAQATAGALTLVGLDNRTGGVDVTYRYTLTNFGDPLSVTVTDDKLGYIGGPVALGTGGSTMFTSEPVTLFGTTMNTATASSTLCPAVTDTVTVTATEPTCDASIMLEKIESKKIKWKLSNPSGIDATIKEIELSWMGGTLLKKVKFDGNDIVKDEAIPSSASLPTDALVGMSQWLKEVKDRTLYAGDSGKTLEFEFTADFPMGDKQPSDDFDLTVTFEKGCSVTF